VPNVLAPGLSGVVKQARDERRRVTRRERLIG